MIRRRAFYLCLLTGWLALPVTAAPLPEIPGSTHLIDFQIEDQFQQQHTNHEFAGMAVVLVWVDRQSRNFSAAWVVALEAAMMARNPQSAGNVRLVAHVKGAPFFVKGRIRNSFGRDPARWVLLDWHGVFQKAYHLQKNQVTVLAFGSHGKLVARYTGTGVVPAAVEALVQAALAEAAPAEAVSVANPPPGSMGEISADGDFASRLVVAAMERLTHHVTYDGRYRQLAYPGGDVPDSIGVCSDVIVRAYRGVGLDLQRAIHEDMLQNFAAYPQIWDLNRPDTNIDHRRVPNLQVFFTRHGQSLPITLNANDFKPGDIVTWMLPGHLPHIGLVVAQRSDPGQRPLVVHNIGSGPVLEDVLFRFPMTGHYRYDGTR